MHDYKKLLLWNKSIEFVSDIYKTTSHFPSNEKFNLISQINRASVAIPSNIAEGAGRNSNKEFVQFLAIAHGSTYEVETQLMISKNLGYLKEEELQILLEQLYEIQKMSFSLQLKLKK
ncbi:four helix bundle protein [Sphingobacterium kyonggiense]|uniref:Four helix bundle protein n=1 Tax=Sphingobacterium kyonggiense TaxID=714075 RepID=A0ABP7Z1N8_9SPHI